MRLCIVPMKPLARTKERLAPVLSPAQRRELSLAMLADVCLAAAGFDVVWVLNSDADAAGIAAASGARPRPDPTPDGGLNASLSVATAEAVVAGATGILVISADVPAATPEDLAAVAAEPGVAVAPDHAGVGTNALWREPADVIEVAYGPRSGEEHERRARVAGAAFRSLALPRLALDIDRPEDLRAAAVADVGPATRSTLASLGS